MEDYRDIIKEWRQRPNEKYGGYHLADRPAADPELTETGPRTPPENIGGVSGFRSVCPRK